MKRLLSTIDRWGPALVSVIALFIVCGMGWISSERIARIEGREEGLQEEINQRIQLEVALRTEIQVWQAHTVKLRELMVQACSVDGKSIPPAPAILQERKK